MTSAATTSARFDSELAQGVLTRLRERGLVTDRLSLDGPRLRVAGAGELVIAEKHLRKWLPSINTSLYPQSLAPEAKRHLLYAILQDLVRPELLLHQDTSTGRPLSAFDPALAPFENVYQTKGERGRIVLFPLHIAVPLVFDTYGRKTDKHQTDKGFRGPIIEFFSTDAAGFRHDLLTKALKQLFASTAGFNVLDRALVRALHLRFVEHHGTRLAAHGGASLQDVDGDWLSVYKPDQQAHRVRIRPLASFAEQGERLTRDLQVLSRHPALSRIDRISRVEMLLGYHLALYLLRVTRVLYDELDQISARLLSDQPSEWYGRTSEVALLYESRQTRASLRAQRYAQTITRINEATILLPVLNNVELAIRAACGRSGDVVTASQLCWADAKDLYESRRTDETSAAAVEVLRFLGALALEYAGADEDLREMLLARSPVSTMAAAARLHFQGDNRRYTTVPQNVFQSIAKTGPKAFIQEQGSKYFSLGDDLLSSLVLVKFDEPLDNDLGVERETQPEARASRRRMSLTRFEERLQDDLIVPADDRAREELRATLARLGLLDRLSDAGGANFLRHPLHG